MTKKVHQKKIRLPRKLKKAAHLCTTYYDGYMVALPIWRYDRDVQRRHTKYMYRLCDRYWLYWDWENGYDTHGLGHKRGELIRECLSDIYHAKRHYHITLKHHKKCGEIFTYCWMGVVYPNGAWVPKVKPKDEYYRCCYPKGEKPESESYFVTRDEYSYEKLQRVRIEKFIITKEEFDDKNTSGCKLFLKYMSECPEKLIKIKQEK